MFSGLRNFLLKFLGYDRAVLQRMAARDTVWLAIAGAWSLLSAIAFAASGTYLVYLGVYSDKFLLPVAAIAFATIFLFALNMQRMFVTSGGFGYHWDNSLLAGWRPDPLRLVIVVSLAVLFSQPWLLMLKHASLDEKMTGRVAAVVSIYEGNQAAGLTRHRAELLQQRALLEQQFHLLGVQVPMRQGQAANVQKAAVRPSLRKALVIGMRKYGHAPVLAQAAAAANDTKHALEDLGFHVSILTDASYDDVLMAADSYIKSVQPGDMSFIYFAGYAFNSGGQAYLAPIDFTPAEHGPGLNLNQLIEDIGARLPQMSVVLIDGVRPALANLGPLASVRPAPNTFVAIAGQISVSERAAVWDGALTHAVLRNIARADDIKAVFGMAKADLAATRNAKQEPRSTPVIISSLGSGYRQIAPGPAKSEASTAASLRGACGENETELAACMNARLYLIDSHLDDLDTAYESRLKRRAEAYSRALAQSGMVRERWMSLWSNPWSSLALTLVGILFMSGGDWLRDAFPAQLRHYERERVALARGLIEQRYRDAKGRVSERLARFPVPILPVRRWHELDSYFDASVLAVPLRDAPFEPHGSPDELLDRLDWDALPPGTAA